MSRVRRAVIDIGTNSVKLLVGDVSKQDVLPILETSEQTRLGKDFYETHRLQSDAIAATAHAVMHFAKQARRLQSENIRVFATSAARDASNQRELVQAVEQASGLKVEIISGKQEADWAFAGVTSDSSLKNQPLLIVDVGGGSTELILGHGSIQYFRESFPLGSVRLLEQITPSDPPHAAEWQACRSWLKKFLDEEIRPALEPCLKQQAQGVQLVGTGGAASILACIELNLSSFDRERIEAARLKRDAVWRHQERLWACCLAERKKIVGLPPNRADVILTGAAIFAMIMEEFDFAELRASTRGLRFGALMAAES